MVQDEPEREIGKRHAGWKIGLHLLHASQRVAQVRGREVKIAPVLGGPRVVDGHGARQAAFIKRHPRNHGDAQLLAHREQFVFRGLVEDVVDHLHRIDEPTLQGLDDIGRFPAVHADADRLDEPFGFQIGHSALPAVVVGPRVGPHVELLEVDAVHAKIGQAPLGGPPDVVGGEDVFEPVGGARGPPAVLGWHLRRDDGPRASPIAKHVADQLLAVAVAVRAGGVEEVAAQLETAHQGGARRLVVSSAPSAHAPGAKAHFGHLPPQPSKCAVFHPDILPRRTCTTGC